MGKILDTINEPSDIKNLSLGELEELALEIRRFLLETLAQTGGHLAPNLGVVELTLALHSVFDSPKDQIVWDVGHQSYVHKILTGRREQFASLRQFNGISGFPKPEESPHDVFATGHSSTSISVGVGLAKARDLAGQNHKVIAVIGDGSLTGGMAYEALNNVGQLHTDMLIVLNDNEMSISKNVGAMSRYLTRLRTNPRLRKIKTELQEMIRKVPRVGHATVRYLEKLEDGLSYLVIPGMLFEELGITYLGPIDGHDIALLKSTLKDAAELKGPVMVHVLTTKGKGYCHAEDNPQKFHSTGQFHLDDGMGDATGAVSYTEVFSETILDLARRDQRIVAITAAMAAGTGLLPFAREFPERFIDVGIAEQHAVTLAAGMAKQGFRPVVAIYSTFLQRAYDQVIHDVCLQNLPVLLMLDRAGLVGPDGPTHHGVFDLAFLRQIPNMTVMAPSNDREFRQMIFTALQINGPVAIRYPRRNVEDVKNTENYQLLPLGKGEVLRHGRAIALIAVGAMVKNTLEAADKLHTAGVSCTVVNARFIKPLDKDLILRVALDHDLVVTIEENIIAGGFGSAVLEFLAKQQSARTDCMMLGVPDDFVTHGSNEILLKLCGLDPEGICRTVLERYKSKPVSGKKQMAVN